jgi:hypothetical protein
MARNPWLKINPITDIATQSQSGNDLVYGIAGKVISWTWLLSGLFLLFYGFIALKRLGGLEKNLSYLLLTPVVASWLAAVATIGDHRFRISTMSLSLVLQVVGLMSLKKKFVKG